MGWTFTVGAVARKLAAGAGTVPPGMTEAVGRKPTSRTAPIAGDGVPSAMAAATGCGVAADAMAGRAEVVTAKPRAMATGT